MKSIQEIRQLIDDEDFESAKDALFELKRLGDSGAIPDYILGCLFDDYRNPQRSQKQAKYHFRLAIQTDTPVEDAFVELARIEKHGSPHRIRILKHGLSYFPNSMRIHDNLLISLEAGERESLFTEMVSAELLSINSVVIMVRTYLEFKNYKKALDLVSTFWVEDKKDDIVSSFIKACCHYRTDDIKRACKIFTELIETDITHKLSYAQYYGLILCFLKSSNLSSALEIFEQIPFEDEIQCPYAPDFGPLDGLYQECANQAITALLSSTKSRRVLAKARGLRALIESHVEFEQNLTRAKLLADFRFANKYIPDNRAFCLGLAYHAIEDEHYQKAHQYTVQYLRNAAWLGQEALEEANYSYVHDAPETIFDEIQKSLRALLEKGDYRDMKVLPKGPCVPVIERLFQAKQYQDVVLMADAMSKELFDVDEILFEAAYSYSECAKHSEAKRCYEIYDKKFPGMAAAENNLGVLYESEGDLINARIFFEKALNRDKNSELYKRNLTRVISIEKAIDNILQSSLNIKRAMLTLWYERDIDNLFSDVAKVLSNQLSLSGEDIDSLVNELEDSQVIIGVRDGYHNYDHPTYRLNPFLLGAVDLWWLNIEQHGESV